MRAHRVVATMLLFGLGALGAPTAIAAEGPPSSPDVMTTSSPAASGTMGPEVEADPSTTATPAHPSTAPSRTSATVAAPAPQPEPTTTTPDVNDARPAPAAATAEPRASIGTLDCTALSVPVSLDNAAAAATTFVIVLRTGAGPSSRQEELVAAGATVEKRVSLVDNSYNELSVSAQPSGLSLATAGPVFCGEKPRVTIDTFDCTALQAPVTLDNRRGAAPFLFDVQWFWSNTDYDQSEPYTVEAGAVRVVNVPLVDNAWTSVWVREGFGFVPTPPDQLLVTKRALCGLEPGAARVAVSAVDCAQHTVTVTIDTRQTPPRRPRSPNYWIATAYSGKTSYSRSVEGKDVHRVTVPVRIGTVGRLTVKGTLPGATPPIEVLYSERLDASCPSGPPSTAGPSAPGTSGPSTPAGGEQLPATGGSAIPPLLLALGLGVGGAILVRLSRRLPSG